MAVGEGSAAGLCLLEILLLADPVGPLKLNVRFATSLRSCHEYFCASTFMLKKYKASVKKIFFFFPPFSVKVFIPC